MYPTTNLQPGATGAEVKKLQDYLVSQGYMTQEQVDTGYGTYGPRTTAAVKALQEKLGVDNSTGPGYWGPRTLAAVQSLTVGSPIGTTQEVSTTSQDQGLTTILANPNLGTDQKSIIQAVYDATSQYDIQKAARLSAAIKASFQMSDPYYKEQSNLVIDALRTGLSQREGDVNFQIGQRQRSLEETRNNVAASKDYLTFQQSQELADLERKKVQDLEASREQMAATGFTVSSRRNKAERLIEDVNQGFVQSSNRQFAYQTGNLNRQLGGAEQNTQAEIARLQQNLKDYGQNLFRTTEEKLGSTAVGTLGLPYGSLGGISGELPYQQSQDALSFARNSGFVF